MSDFTSWGSRRRSVVKYAYANRSSEMEQKSLYSPDWKAINPRDQRKDEILALKSSLNLAHYEARLPLQSVTFEKLCQLFLKKKFYFFGTVKIDFLGTYRGN